MLRVIVAAALALPACGESVEEIDLVLAGQCAADDLSPVSVLSVEILGIDDSGRPCALARRCVFDVALASIEDVTAALEAANQPLIDVSDPDAHTLRVVGHTDSCFAFDDVMLFGENSLLEVTGGQLEIDLSCGARPAEEILFCP